MRTDKTISAESHEQRKEMPNKIGADMNSHKILTLEEAAAFLRIDQSTLRVRAAAGTIPGAKISHKAWRFIEADLLAWLRGKYQQCPSTNNPAQNFGLSISLSKDSGLDEALAPRRKSQRRNTTTA